MSSDLVIGLMAQTINVTLFVAAPVLIVGLLVGVSISLVQAVTQVQELTLVFVPKIIAVMITIVAALPWMMNLLVTFTTHLFSNIPVYIK